MGPTTPEGSTPAVKDQGVQESSQVDAPKSPVNPLDSIRQKFQITQEGTGDYLKQLGANVELTRGPEATEAGIAFLKQFEAVQAVAEADQASSVLPEAVRDTIYSKLGGYLEWAKTQGPLSQRTRMSGESTPGQYTAGELKGMINGIDANTKMSEADIQKVRDQLSSEPAPAGSDQADTQPAPPPGSPQVK